MVRQTPYGGWATDAKPLEKEFRILTSLSWSPLFWKQLFIRNAHSHCVVAVIDMKNASGDARAKRTAKEKSGVCDLRGANCLRNRGVFGAIRYHAFDKTDCRCGS